jgi:uncharacterized protein
MNSVREDMLMSALNEQIRTLRGRNVLIVISLILNIVLAFGIYSTFYRMNLYSEQVKALSDQNEDLNNQILSLKRRLEFESEQLAYYKKQAEYYSRISKHSSVGESLTGYSRMNIVAVRSVTYDFFESGYEGIILSAEVELQKGEGRRLINTEPKIGIDMQTSLGIAVSVAESITGVSLNLTDIILTIRAEREVEIIDGPSAGAAVTLCLIAAIQNRTIDSSVFITGTVNPDESIGKVGGVLEKATAVSDIGGEIFLVPSGQSQIQGYKPVKNEPIPGFTIITYEPYQIDLQDELNKINSQTKVIEVRNVREAIAILFL